MRLAQRELRVDDQHVLLADDHRRVDVVADLAAAGVHLQRELRLRAGDSLSRTPPSQAITTMRPAPIHHTTLSSTAMPLMSRNRSTSGSSGDGTTFAPSCRRRAVNGAAIERGDLDREVIDTRRLAGRRLSAARCACCARARTRRGRSRRASPRPAPRRRQPVVRAAPCRGSTRGAARDRRQAA